MQSVLIMQRMFNLKKTSNKFGEEFVGLLEKDGYSNRVSNWGSYLILQKSPL